MMTYPLPHALRSEQWFENPDESKNMGYQAYKSAMGSALLTLAIGGCATGTYQEPTHRWVSSSQATENQYRADNAACGRETVGTATQRVFETDTPEFSSYVACMNRRGYALTANEVASSR